MKHVYEIIFCFDLGKASAPVGELANELNDHLAKVGCSEKLAITAELPAMTLTSSRKLTKAEIETVKEVTTKQLVAAFPSWNVRLASFYRKPGNVQQSVEQ